MIYRWDHGKNEKLKSERGISFERIIVAIDSGDLLDILEHHNPEKFPNQILIVVNIENYAWVVPAVIEEEYYFLKTIFPSRKFTDLYLPEARK